MQTSITTRHFGPGQIKKAALAIAILTSTAIGVTTATIVRDASDNDTGRVAVVTSALADREQEFGYQFLEQNLDLPTGGAVPAASPDANYLFMEQNLYLPASHSAPDWRILEQNSWGENFVLPATDAGTLYPSADDVPQPMTADVSY